MKKSFLSISIICSIVLFSCKNETPVETIQATEITTTENPEAETTTKIQVKTPTFADSEVQQSATDYSNFIHEIMEASKNEDLDKLNELMQKQVEWSQKIAQMLKKMSAEDVQKWKEWEADLRTATQDL